MRRAREKDTQGCDRAAPRLSVAVGDYTAAAASAAAVFCCVVGVVSIHVRFLSGCARDCEVVPAALECISRSSVWSSLALRRTERERGEEVAGRHARRLSERITLPANSILIAKPRRWSEVSSALKIGDQVVYVGRGDFG